MLHKLRKLVNYYVPLWDFCYILQLEEYNLQRYARQAWQRLLKRNFEQRDQLQFTGRMKLTFFLTILLLLPVGMQDWSLVLWTLLIPVITPWAILIASAMVSIPVYVQKKRRLQQAQAYFKKNYPETKVIAVTGSFGKTTAKYLLQHVLQYDYKTAIIPDNLNTSLGIANYILAGKVPSSTELLIVEMGAYQRGDIAEAATVTPPDYALITIYGDQHLERFGSHTDIIRGKSEIYTTHSKTVCYLSEQDQAKAEKESLPTDQLRLVQVPEGKKTTSYLVSKLAQDLGVTEASIQKSLETFTPPDRRNNIIERQGVTIVDNSYNISPMVAEAMLKEAAETAASVGKSLVVMTGGIGEQGIYTTEVNQTLGTLLNKHASRVIINDTIYAQYILERITIPYKTVRLRTEVTDNPSKWLDGKQEVLLWLTGHGDLAYL